MNRIMKVSLLFGLSSLLIACGGGSDTPPIPDNAPSDIANINPSDIPNLPSESNPPPSKKQENTESTTKKDNDVNTKDKLLDPSVTSNIIRKKQEMNLAFLGELGGYFSVSCVSPSELCPAQDAGDKQINVYTLTTNTDDQNREKTTETFQTIVLNTGTTENKEQGYKFTLLENQKAYYGYRQRAQIDKLGRHYQFIYSVDSDVIQDLPLEKDYTANYKGEFLYSPYSLSDQTSNNVVKSGEAEVAYKNGDVTGKIYNKGHKEQGLFDITGKDRNLVITSNKDIAAHSNTNISPNQKAGMSVTFASPKKYDRERKYLFGAVKATPSQGTHTKDVGFVGVLYAEKQDK
ncbi:hypothetical protein ACPEEL_09930 [Pasteurella sp. PK-2025]|uniref:hypothetical protein n=1 Tax=unclassified Pasteurella TaxID=2621516 RepID=UPI003C77AF7B